MGASLRRPDFLIVGAGVIGCAVARELAIRRAGTVVVVDSGLPGAEASAAAAGVLAVSSSRSPGGAILRLKRASARLFPALVASLEDETGVDVEYRDSGLLELAFGENDARQLAIVAAKRNADGHAVELLDAAQVREMEPTVADAATGGAFFPSDSAINNTSFVDALRASAEIHGVRFLANHAFRKCERDGRRLRSVVAGDECFEPGELIIAAGVGSRAVGAVLKAKMPIRPDRGEMVAVRPRQLPVRTTVWRDGYLVPRRNGELLIGATSGRGDDDKTVRAASLELLLGRAIEMIPDLGHAPLVRQWAGVRPMCTLRRPILGPVEGYENVTVATGHHRSGILLAPITALMTADSVMNVQAGVELAPFKYKKKP